MKIAIINGPNINMIGYRDIEKYGDMSYQKLQEYLNGLYDNLYFFQSNHEGDIIDFIQKIKFNEDQYLGVILNLGGYTHTSIAIADSVELLNITKVEVHLSDVNNREEFRKISYIRYIVDKMFCSKKELSYKEAIDYIITKEKNEKFNTRIT